jgi:AcrR family transcriptional regulator
MGVHAAGVAVHHLDVSIAALYHHVTGKDDLLRLAAEVSAQKVPLPQDTDQHWAVRNMNRHGLASIEPSDDLPYLAQLWSEAGERPLPRFEGRLVLVLSSIAAARGVDVAEVRALLERFVTAERRRVREVR